MQKTRFRLILAAMFAFLIINFLNLTYTNAAGIVTETGSTLNVNDGTLNLPEEGMSNAGSLTQTTGTIKIGGDWANTGSFSGGSGGAVEFMGAAASTITGANTFVNFTATQAGKQLNFEAGKTQIITGAWTLAGASGNLMKLRSTIAGTQWNVNPLEIKNISFVDVKDSNNQNSETINPTSSTDGGNNINWFAVAATPTPSPSVTPTPSPAPSPTETETVTPTPTIKPTSKFEADPTGGFEPLTVTFIDLSEGKPTSWAWEFGDGGISSTQNPTHTYKVSGNFNVKLKVCNSNGCDTDEQVNLIDVASIGKCNPAFNVDKTSGFAPLNVKFTDLSTGDPTGWQWDFGDGDVSDKQNPSHEYKVAGVFSVELKITAKCGTDALKQTNLITVEELPKPTAEFNANPTSGFAPIDVQFNNLSAGKPSSFAWLFGDGGSSSKESPKYRYNIPGIYTVTLMVSNQSGTDVETKTNLINIESEGPPKAEFEASPLTGFGPLNVQFNDLSTGNVSNWTWSFGDGAVSSLRNPTHSYLSPGFYNPKLLVSGANGTGVEEKINLITVNEGEEPTAAFTAEPLTGNAPFTTHFFDLSSGEISNYAWEFGDNNVSLDQNPVHTFKTPGQFTVKLTVSGKNGTSIATKTSLVTVTEGDAPTAAFAVNNRTQDDDPDQDDDSEDDNGDDDDKSKDDNSDDDKKGKGKEKERASIVGVTAEKETNSLTVKFINISSSPDNKITALEWDFGDGSEKSSEKSPKHTYLGSPDQAFTVSLTVQNAKGFDTVTKPAFVAMPSGEDFGFVRGKVTGQKSKTAIPDAKIVLNSDDTKVAETSTLNDGTYTLQVPEGDYTLLASKEGFEDALKKVKVKVSETVILNIEMKDGIVGTPTPTPTEGSGISLKVEPKSAKRSLRKNIAVVTALDKNGDPVSGVQIQSSVKGKGAKVSPKKKKTGPTGTAEFQFKFGFRTKNGEIIFKTKDAEPVVITQK